ncbi:macrophage erythroblast attacher [Trichuris trichiura]|uniref:E3 ubiquitin-protein transferase MAEA n=1 Tax=Trichuris trichiura TaxID=36087 RepID=A0A077YXB7_TRITR|nr:macrophage erythroblast attacher [Trichuris trichiura]
MSDIWALEHSTLAASYEELNKAFRVAQKTLDRESVRSYDLMREIEQFLKGPVVSVNHLRPLIEGVQEQIIKIKEKLMDCVSQEKALTDSLKTKLTHLKAHRDKDMEDSFRRLRLERILVDYMLRCGYYDTAVKVAERSGIAQVTNIAHFIRAKKVEESLAAHHTNECLEWCHENRSKLRRLKSTFELKVRQQDFIELLRNNERTLAINYARKHFGKLDQDTFHVLLPTMTLLAVGVDTTLEQYQNLWSASRWESLINEFRSENYRLYNMSEYSPFSACFQCGISAIKTTRCVSSGDGCMEIDNGDQEATKKVPECPVCIEEVRPLADGLPIGRVSHSKLICAYSGEILNENNPPFVLPNGMVYGQSSLLAIAAENDGKIVCPRTKQRYSLKEADRVFVL